MLRLDGQWEFTYRHDLEDIPETFDGTMPVPGQWDDHLEPLKELLFWSTAKFNPDYRPLTMPLGANPRDASLPFLYGVGWYRKEFFLPEDWRDKTITLRLGPVVLEVSVWLNGQKLTSHVGHGAPFDVKVDSAVRFGAANELILAVSNLRDDRPGCDLRGFAGCGGGFRGGVSLHASSLGGEPELSVLTAADLSELMFRLEVPMSKIVKFTYVIRGCDDGRPLVSGEMEERGPVVEWSVDAKEMRPWSDIEPTLYDFELQFEGGERIARRIGLRHIERRGVNLFLNGKPVYLRGATDHAFFPLTCFPTRSESYYRSYVRTHQALGFNWLRFHTWIPPKEFMHATDELGMMIQVEAAPGSGLDEWREILRYCREHPSVVIVCEGNEELLDEAKIASLAALADLVGQEAPGVLFNPQEALRGVDYGNVDDMGDAKVMEPFPHNPERLSRLRDFSDVFAPYTWAMGSYGSLRGNVKEFDSRLSMYQRPCLAHEICIHGSYINLDLEHRYEGTRIGPDLYRAARGNLVRHGLADNAFLYFRNSCAWMKRLRKHAVETIRGCANYAGYDLLGATDQHWHRTGYDCGIMNEFLEMKPGETPNDVMKYNGASVLLLDLRKRHNYWEKDSISATLRCSHFGSSALRNCRVEWMLATSGGQLLRSGGWKLANVAMGDISSLGDISFEIPTTGRAIKTKLIVRLFAEDAVVENDWPLWIFPKVETPSTKSVRLIQNLDDATLDWIRQGGSAVLVGLSDLPSLPAGFQMTIAGRSSGNAATVIWDHPALASFPHDGYCDWQFYAMLNDAESLLFKPGVKGFEPIVEAVSSYKTIRRQALLFEGRLGRGRLLACGFKLPEDDPAAVTFRSSLLKHADDKRTAPDNQWPDELLNDSDFVKVDFSTDQALDPNVKKGAR